MTTKKSAKSTRTQVKDIKTVGRQMSESETRKVKGGDASTVIGSPVIRGGVTTSSSQNSATTNQTSTNPKTGSLTNTVSTTTGTTQPSIAIKEKGVQ